MNARDVAQWKRCEEIAADYNITIKLQSGFVLTDKQGAMLGVIETVAEVYAFLCGYEYSTTRRGDR